MFWKFETDFHSRESDARKNSGEKNYREHAADNQEQQIVAGVERRESYGKNSGEINHSLFRDAIIHLIREPAKRRAARESGYRGDSGPTCESESAETCGA